MTQRIRRWSGRWSAILPAVVAVVGSCGIGSSDPPVLQLSSFRQAEAEAVCLNENLVFHFSRDLDRSSITSESVRIRTGAGEPVTGRFEVRGSTLELVPDLPRKRDLSDGGLRPGMRYNVHLLGFPAAHGVRGRGGEPLEASYRTHFVTAEPDTSDLVFLNPYAEILHPLVPTSLRIGPLDPIVLECGEALDPSNLDGSQFRFGRFREDFSFDEIPLRATLVVNERDRARVELQPASKGGVLPALEPNDEDDFYHLMLRDPDEYTLTSLGGRTVMPLWGLGHADIKVVAGPEVSRVVEGFDDASRRSTLRFDGVDGTAFWNMERGRVEVRFPAAAGDGHDGDGQALLADLASPPSLDVSATRLTIPKGETLDLSGVTGLVVLRSQGPLDIEGDLTRSLGGRPNQEVRENLGQARGGLLGQRNRLLDRAKETGEDLTKELEALGGRLATLGTLSGWLEHAHGTGEAWTVLITGGDLRVRGRIDVEGSLVLIAGGWIHVPGRVSAPEVLLTRPGGGNIYTPSRDDVRELAELELELDPPLENPLRQPLRLAVSSQPIRPERGVEHWRTPLVEGGHGVGSFVVRYFGVRERAGGGPQTYGPVDDLVPWLETCEAVSFRIDLEVPAADVEPRWDPPWVDSVEISWYEPEGAGE